jgi:hypothetical protein
VHSKFSLYTNGPMDAVTDAKARMAAMCRRIWNFSSVGLAACHAKRAALQVQAIPSQGISFPNVRGVPRPIPATQCRALQINVEFGSTYGSMHHPIISLSGVSG